MLAIPCLLVLGALSAACQVPGAPPFTVEAAPEWDAVFDTTAGWTGADGIYAIPLDGDERPGGVARSDTLFLFSDTFIGDVTPGGARENSTIINNTLGFLPAGGFPRGMRFHWDDSGAQPAAVFVPTTPQTEAGDWYWLSDGIALGDTVHVFAMRMRSAPGAPGFAFARSGMARIDFPYVPTLDPAAAVQIDTPLAIPERPGRGPCFLGAGIFANTAAAGAPHPDGYIYVYGIQEDPGNKRLLVARVRPDDFTDFRAWRYWNGSGWARDPRDAAPQTGRLSNELSVTPLPDGRYALIFQRDTLAGRTSMKISDTPFGPWSAKVDLWTAVTPPGIDVFTYNAKAHPHLSDPGTLLVSYNINAVDFWDHFRYADIYRPRFFRITWQ
jgi:hypothetical protein